MNDVNKVGGGLCAGFVLGCVDYEAKNCNVRV